ncbi:MAG: peroxidase family protein [Pseudomonadota bacterium]
MGFLAIHLLPQNDSLPNPVNASDMLWQWGQFLDHDIDLTDGVEPEEPANITVPAGDPFFDPTGVGTAVINLNRSIYDAATGTDANNPRQQLNEITAWIDASNVYGSDSERADALRTLDGTGRLKVSEGNLLPFNTSGLANAGGNSASLFLAGDVRANEQIGLLAMHTLFVREHNRLATNIAQDNPNLDGNQIYERARKIVGAQMQVITYREYLPLLLGRNGLSPYRGYRENVDASIANIFSTAAYRYGHSALSPTLLRLDQNGNEISEGNLQLRDAFFSPQRLSTEGGIEPVLRGLASQICQNIDPFVIDEVRNFLFGPPGSGGFDLVSLNIQRGRDHGLPSYNDAREALGLGRKQSFAQISNDLEVQSRLTNAYGSVDNIDAWVGGLAETQLPGTLVGEFMFTVLKRQFEALRDGDRFWYERTLTQQEIDMVENTSLAEIIRRNTDIGQELSNNVFRVNN